MQDLKQKIEEDKGKDYPVGGQKLIYAGKILEDKSRLTDCQIEDGKFIVVMVTKPKPATATPEEQPPVVAAPTPTPTPGPVSAPTPAPANSTATPAAT